VKFSIDKWKERKLAGISQGKRFTARQLKEKWQKKFPDRKRNGKSGTYL